MISFSTVELDGHTYDAELLAAPLRAVQARASSQRQADRLAHLERALALRAQRLHGAVGPGRCSCGLVLPRGADHIDRADGHLDLDSWQPAYTVVLYDGDETDRPYAAVCRCGWRERFARAQDAQDAGRDHATEAATRLEPAGR